MDLQEQIKYLTSGFDLLADQVILTDRNGVIIYANSAVYKNTGFTPTEVVGKNPGTLWGNRMPRDFYKAMWHKIKVEKRPFVGEVENVHKDGSRFWQELRISPVLDEQDEVIFFIGLETDISARKVAEHKEKILNGRKN